MPFTVAPDTAKYLEQFVRYGVLSNPYSWTSFPAKGPLAYLNSCQACHRVFVLDESKRTGHKVRHFMEPEPFEVIPGEMIVDYRPAGQRVIYARHVACAERPDFFGSTFVPPGPSPF